MKARRSDKELTIALCASLLVHAALMGLLVHEQIKMLLQELRPIVVANAYKPPPVEKLTDPKPDELPPQLLQPASDPPQEFEPRKPPPPPPPPKQKKPTNQNDENIDWGEKDAHGIAITSSPGNVPLSARKGMEDQASASRDPEGPEVFPDEPSLSQITPGDNGDGRKPVPNAAALKGTQGDPAAAMAHPEQPLIPPAPKLARPKIAVAEGSVEAPQTSGASTSQLPIPEKRSPPEPNAPAGGRDAIANDAAFADAQPVLPVKQGDLIATPSAEPAYPQEVEALLRPPGLTLPSNRLDPVDPMILGYAATADVRTAPLIQPATAALAAQPQTIEEMAQRLGESDPRSGPAMVEALLHTPGDASIVGGDAPLPQLALADRPGGARMIDAIIPFEIDQSQEEELAQQIQPSAQPTPAGDGTAGSVASATGGLAGPRVNAADPAPDTGLESDPFAKIPGVDFHDGKVEARSGRVVKPIRPRLTDAARRDLMAMPSPMVVFKVHIDKTGKVKDVNVVQSSGSEAVDMPVYRALWEWWFEPPKDKKGNPLEDVQLVTIHWG